MMVFIHIHLPNKPGCYWAFKENGSIFAAPDALYAEAFDEQSAIAECFGLSLQIPGVEVSCVPCDSEKLIPPEMRKVLRI